MNQYALARLNLCQPPESKQGGHIGDGQSRRLLECQVARLARYKRSRHGGVSAKPSRRKRKHFFAYNKAAFFACLHNDPGTLATNGAPGLRHRVQYMQQVAEVYACR